MKTVRAALRVRTVRGRRARLLRPGTAVRRRPVRSPAFQKRKASGMKQDGWRSRGSAAVSLSSAAGVRTLTICCVKTGKNIVRAKVMKRAVERWRSLRKRVPRPTTLRVGVFEGV